jgi:hypothetical protein
MHGLCQFQLMRQGGSSKLMKIKEIQSGCAISHGPPTKSEVQRCRIFTNNFPGNCFHSSNIISDAVRNQGAANAGVAM